MLKYTRILPATFFTAVLLFAATARAGEDEDKARAVLEKNKLAVVTVKLVIKQKVSMPGRGSQEDESKVEATGTVIGPDGLTVVALSSTDPSSVYKNMMSSMMSDVQIECDVSDVKILLDDGTEVPSQIVLRDNDLDLAYVRPTEKPAKPFNFVDLADAATPQILERLVALNRMGQVANRVYAAAFERVEAIVTKPRTFYIPGKDPTNSAQGSPVFTLDGKIVGVFVLRTIKDTGGGRSALFGDNPNMLPVLLPASEILEGAKQAPPFAEK
jgi:hypothetical protein